MEEQKEYQIAGKSYYQQELRIAQIIQLVRLLDSIELPEGAERQELSVGNLLHLLGDRLTEFLAIILNPKGISRQAKNMVEIKSDMEEITQSQLMEILDDFFTFSKPSDLVAWFNRLVRRFLPGTAPKRPGKGSSATSVKAMSPKGN